MPGRVIAFIYEVNVPMPKALTFTMLSLIASVSILLRVKFMSLSGITLRLTCLIKIVSKMKSTYGLLN